jgi:adenine-specific DNA-methyltransferase
LYICRSNIFFHSLYLNLFSAPKTDLLFAYLLTDVCRHIFEDNRREYGNGLQKFEPNDINKSLMLDLERLDNATEKEILGYYHLYRQSVLDKMPDERFVGLMNEVFVGCFT